MTLHAKSPHQPSPAKIIYPHTAKMPKSPKSEDESDFRRAPGYCPGLVLAEQTKWQLIKAVDSQNVFNKFSGALEAGVGAKQRLLTHCIRLMWWSFNYQDFNLCPREFTYSWFVPFLQGAQNVFDSGFTQKKENVWQLASVFCRIRNFNNKIFFNSVSSGIHAMAKHSPALLWRVITLHNCPWCPPWLDEERMSKEFREAMDSAAAEGTAVEKLNVESAKKMLRQYYDEELDLDLPDREVCLWLGFEEDDMDHEAEAEDDLACCCDGVPRAGCPVHGANGNSRSFLEAMGAK